MTDIEGHDDLSLVMRYSGGFYPVDPRENYWGNERRFETGHAANPNISATWRGDMSGWVPNEANSISVRGTAEITYHLGSATTDVRLTEIRGDSEHNSLQPYDPLIWEGLSVRNGLFHDDADAYSATIRGAFSGQEQEGVYGHFTRRGLAGKFGALREQQP